MKGLWQREKQSGSQTSPRARPVEAFASKVTFNAPILTAPLDTRVDFGNICAVGGEFLPELRSVGSWEQNLQFKPLTFETSTKEFRQDLGRFSHCYGRDLGWARFMLCRKYEASSVYRAGWCLEPGPG